MPEPIIIEAHNQPPPNSERSLFSAIESMLNSSCKNWTTELVVKFASEDVEELARRARHEGTAQKITIKPEHLEGTDFNTAPCEDALALVVMNAAKNLRPGLAKQLRDPNCFFAGYEHGEFIVNISLPEVNRVPTGMLPMRSG